MRLSVFSFAFSVALYAAMPVRLAHADERICHPVETEICHTVKTHHAVHHARHHAAPKATGCNPDTREAEQELSDLGYYNGAIDCADGPALRDAVKHFQRDHGLKADGVLGSKTRAALRKAAHPAYGRTARYVPLARKNGRVTGMGEGSALSGGGSADSGQGPVDDDFATGLNGGTKSLNSRFARLDVTENGATAAGDKRYDVNLNGSPILTVDNQPSVIGISQVFDLGDEEAVIFTTYAPEGNCMYKHYVLAMTPSATQTLPMENCTRRAEGQVVNHMLNITFPERDSNPAIGDTWRLQGMFLQQL